MALKKSHKKFMIKEIRRYVELDGSEDDNYIETTYILIKDKTQEKTSNELSEEIEEVFQQGRLSGLDGDYYEMKEELEFHLPKPDSYVIQKPKLSRDAMLSEMQYEVDDIFEYVDMNDQNVKQAYEGMRTQYTQALKNSSYYQDMNLEGHTLRELSYKVDTHLKLGNHHSKQLYLEQSSEQYRDKQKILNDQVVEKETQEQPIELDVSNINKSRKEILEDFGMTGSKSEELNNMDDEQLSAAHKEILLEMKVGAVRAGMEPEKVQEAQSITDMFKQFKEHEVNNGEIEENQLEVIRDGEKATLVEPGTNQKRDIEKSQMMEAELDAEALIDSTSGISEFNQEQPMTDVEKRASAIHQDYIDRGLDTDVPFDEIAQGQLDDERLEEIEQNGQSFGTQGMDAESASVYMAAVGASINQQTLDAAYKGLGRKKPRVSPAQWARDMKVFENLMDHAKKYGSSYAEQFLSDYEKQLEKEREFAAELNQPEENYVDKFLGRNQKEENVTEITVKNRTQLVNEVNKSISEKGPNADLNHLNTSQVTDMSGVFKETNFNGDISKWDTSNVRNMSGMFEGSKFNGDISNWNTSNVTDMSRMFKDSRFNHDISSWNTSNVTNMKETFAYSSFGQKIGSLDTKNVVEASGMLKDSEYSHGEQLDINTSPDKAVDIDADSKQAVKAELEEQTKNPSLAGLADLVMNKNELKEQLGRTPEEILSASNKKISEMENEDHRKEYESFSKEIEGDLAKEKEREQTAERANKVNDMEQEEHSIAS